MGKDGGFLTPKAISNRIKAKGLNKLRWYCQMCEKTCRDANGFKCHLTSEAHQRQMMMFTSDPTHFLTEYSNEFHNSFMEVLRRRGHSRILANSIYQEVLYSLFFVQNTSSKFTNHMCIHKRLSVNDIIRI